MFLYVFGRFFVFHEALISAEKYISRSWAFGNCCIQQKTGKPGNLYSEAFGVKNTGKE
jgi:hypothetical protein